MQKHLPILFFIPTISSCASPPKFNSSDTQLPPCGVFPNCVHSDGNAGNRSIAPLQAGQAQWQLLQKWIASQDHFSVVKQQPNFMHFVAYTPTLRFRDDVQLLFRPQLGVIQLRSSSRLGISDMGANRKRIETLRQRLASLEQ